MKAQQLMDRLLEEIKAATDRRDLSDLTRLSKMAQRVQAIEAQFGALEDELAQIEKSLVGGHPSTSAIPKVEPTFDLIGSMGSGDGEIVIEINWDLCGINRPKARISERKVSETMVSFLEEMQAALGPDVLRKLSGLRVSRGPLVSQNPQHDYVNSKTGAIYVNHPIGHTGFYVLTHSGTPEKIAALKEVWRLLGLTPGAMAIRKS